MAGSALEQPSLLDETWPCSLCNESGRDPRDAAKTCPMCQGARRLTFDPTDLSEIPF